MAKSKDDKDKVTLAGSLFLGGAMSLGSVGGIAGIALVWTWISQSFADALIWYGIVSLYSCLGLCLFPVFGALVSISNKSWYALKIWSAATVVSIVFNIVVGGTALWCGSFLKGGT